MSTIAMINTTTHTILGIDGDRAWVKISSAGRWTVKLSDLRHADDEAGVMASAAAQFRASKDAMDFAEDIARAGGRIQALGNDLMDYPADEAKRKAARSFAMLVLRACDDLDRLA